MIKKIIVFTGNRAEYGLLKPILLELNNSPKIDLNIIVSGAHLEKKFGSTYSEIKKDGFNKIIKIKLNSKDTSKIFTPLSISEVIRKVSQEILLIKPDLFVVYADRFESFGATIAATQLKIPTVHIEGGDLTEGGSLDDSVRHAITKLAHLHLVTNDSAANKIHQMGEEKWRIRKIGLPIIDELIKKNYANEKEITSILNLNLEKPIILFTQHPVSIYSQSTRKHIRESIKALKLLSQNNFQIVITYPNNDEGSRIIVEEINKIDKDSNIIVRKSLGRYLYHGILSLALNRDKIVICVGNSSSGIKETPFFGCPTVNIGSRQQGRTRGSNVVNASYDSEDIYKKILLCAYNKKIRNNCFNTKNPYYSGNSAKKTLKILLNSNNAEKLLNKKFIELN